MNANIIFQVVVIIMVVALTVYVTARDVKREGFDVDNVQTGTLNSNTFTLRDFKDIFNAIYPVGSIYISGDGTMDPNVKFVGTTWKRFDNDFFLMSSTDKSTSLGVNASTRGSNTISEVPRHNHSFSGNRIYGEYTIRTMAKDKTVCGDWTGPFRDGGRKHQDAWAFDYAKDSQLRQIVVFDATPSGSISTVGSSSVSVMPKCKTVAIWQRTK